LGPEKGGEGREVGRTRAALKEKGLGGVQTNTAVREKTRISSRHIGPELKGQEKSGGRPTDGGASVVARIVVVWGNPPEKLYVRKRVTFQGGALPLLGEYGSNERRKGKSLPWNQGGEIGRRIWF